MKALCWHGKGDMRCDTVPDPGIEHPRDPIIKVTACAICGSDLHIYDGMIPTMERGDVIGHETMGEVVEIGAENTKLKIGDRVVVPFTIACGECFFCKRGFFSGCERTNPNAATAEKLWGHSPAGLFGYSHMLGGYRGGQAEYLRVPYADVGPIKVPDRLSDEHVLFLSDIFPTGYMAADFCNIQHGDTIAIWGCGPVGQFAIRSAFLLGAGNLLDLDSMHRVIAGCETMYFSMSVSDEYLAATVNTAAVAKHHGVKAFINMSQMTLAQMSITGSRSRPLWALPGRMCCARQSIAAATSAPSRLSASTGACSTRYQWARRSIAV